MNRFLCSICHQYKDIESITVTKFRDRVLEEGSFDECINSPSKYINGPIDNRNVFSPFVVTCPDCRRKTPVLSWGLYSGVNYIKTLVKNDNYILYCFKPTQINNRAYSDHVSKGYKIVFYMIKFADLCR